MYLNESNGLQGSPFRKLSRAGYRAAVKARAKVLAPIKVLKKVTKVLAPVKIPKFIIKAARKSVIVPRNLRHTVAKTLRRPKKSAQIPTPVITPEIVASPPPAFQQPEPYQAPESIQEPESFQDEQEQEQEQEQDNEQPEFPFSAGDEDGGEDSDGLGKKFWKKSQFKKKTKPLRKLALVAGTAAALYFAAPYALAAGGKLFGKGAAGPAPSGDFQPEPEYGNTTGYEGAASATVPGAPMSSGTLFTPGLFDSAARIAKMSGRLQRGRTGGQQQQEIVPYSVSDSLFTGRNIMLAGGAAVLVTALILMRKSR